MLPKYRELLKYDLSILVFSGDVDAVVPVSLPHETGCLNRVMMPRIFSDVHVAHRTKISATGSTLGLSPS